MKRTLSVLFLLLALAVPAFAGGESVPWKHQTEEFLIEGTARHDGLTDDTLVTIGFGWGHYVTDRTEIGAIVNGLYSNQVDGYSMGPFYRFNFLPILCDDDTPYCRGNLFLTGSLTGTTGDLTDQAAATGAFGLGVRIYTSPGAAVNLSYSYQRAIDPGEAGAGGENALDVQTFGIGLSFGVPQAPGT